MKYCKKGKKAVLQVLNIKWLPPIPFVSFSETITTTSVSKIRAVGQLYSCYTHFTVDRQASVHGMTVRFSQ